MGVTQEPGTATGTATGPGGVPLLGPPAPRDPDTPRRRDDGVITSARDVYSPRRIAEFKERGLWRDELLGDHLARHVRDRPGEDAVVDETGRRLTWAQLDDRVSRIASGLVDAGLRPGDYVAIQVPNRVEFIEVFLAVQRAGLRALTMMSIYREKDVAFMLRTTGARAYIAPDTHRGHDFVAMAARLLDAVESLRTVLIIGEADAGMHAYERLIADAPSLSASAFDHLRPDPDSVSKIGFTSGTTGLPKGVAHTHNTDFSPPSLTAAALGLGPHTPIWMPSPISHATGLLFGVYDSLLCGAKLILQDRWDPGVALDLISRERAAFTVSATPFIGDLLEQDLRGYDLTSFRWFVSGGARVSPTLVERARDEMGTLLLRVFGQSEAPLHTLNFPDDPWEKITGRDGRALPGVEVDIVDANDRTRVLPRGDAVGEYRTAGPHVFLGYYGNPEATAEALDADNNYFSGDLCTLDDDGFVLYVDRIKDIINRGGVKISALEVENLLVAHPLVQQAAVVAMPDDRLGEKVCAFVVTRGGADLDVAGLGAFLGERGVTKQKWPERLELVPELPSTVTGKIQKNVLRDRITPS